MESHDYERVDDEAHDETHYADSHESAEMYDMEMTDNADQAAMVEQEAEAASESVPSSYREEPITLTRIDFLTYSIEQRPDAPVNYLLRAEAYYNQGDEELAAQDYAKVLELADAQAESAEWGYIYESYVDRAQEGLRWCGF